MWTFPKLDAPSVFIAAPGDVHRLRKATTGILHELTRGAAGDDGVDVYDWTTEFRGEGFDDWQPAQTQIPPPSDPMCRAVVCIFGERIGTPLRGVETDRLGRHAEPRPEGARRLVHPWPTTDDEAMRVAESGGFALTGTVFECLAALHANERRGGGDGAGDPPVKIVFIAPPDVADEEPVENADWGYRRHFDEASAPFLEKKDFAGLGSWQSTGYRLQVLQLRNFLRYLRSEGRDPVLTSDDAFPGEIRTFLRRALRVPEADELPDPFKALSAYDVEDTDVFFGREEDRKLALADLMRIWRAPEPTSLGIVSGSGVGKSSFLRAGLVGYLCDPRRPTEHDYHGFVVSPSDLLPHGGNGTEDGDVLLVLHRRALETLARDGRIDEEEVEEAVEALARARPDLRPELAVEALESALGDARLIVGLDQFEEIVDQRGEPGDPWASLVDFVVKAADSARIGVLYTIQSNRFESLGRDPELGRLCAGNRFRTLALPHPLERIIVGTFEAAKVHLDGELLSALNERVADFVADGQDDQGSLMPLLSVALKRIYDRVARPAFEEAREWRRAADASQGDDRGGARDADVATDTGVAQDAELGEDARDAGGEGVEVAVGAGDAGGEGAEVAGQRGDVSSDFNAERGAPSRGASGRGGPGESRGTGAAERVDGAPPRDRDEAVVLTLEQCRDYLNVETAIADLAGEALDEVREAPGPDWSEEDTLAGLLDRLVRPRRGRLHESRFSLPPVPLPASGARRRLAEALMERRILVPDAKRPDHVRLVHEAVLEHWEPAREWLEDRRDLMELEEMVAPSAAQWHDHGRPAERLRPFHQDHVAELLARRWEAWREAADDSELGHLRDYGLTLLREHPDPTRVIPHTDKDEIHLAIAAKYDDAELARRYVETDPACVHAARSDERTALFDAAFVDAVDVGTVLLDAGARIDHADEDGWRPIHAAASWGAEGTFDLLVERGASIEAVGGPGETTTLHLAALNGHEGIARRIVDHGGVDVDRTDTSKWSALHLAARHGHEGLVAILLEHGADTDLRLNYGWSALHIAAEEDAPGVCGRLIAAGTEPDIHLRNGWTPLHIAARDDHPEVARVLLEHGAEVDAVAAHDWSSTIVRAGDHPQHGGWTPLHVAAEKGRVDVARVLLDAGADPEAETAAGSTPLHVAVDGGREEVVAALLEAGADPECPTRGDDRLTPLHVAAREGRAAVVRALLEGGAEPAPRADRGRTPLHHAASRGHADVARALAGLPGADARADDGRNALHMAVEGAHLETAAALVEAGVDVDEPRADGWRALHVAVAGGHDDRVRALLGLGADPDARGPDDATALHLAAEGGHDDAVEALLEAGGDLGARESDGSTPLHAAAVGGWLSALEALLDAGAAVDEPDARGWTALHQAAWHGKTGALGVLLRRGGDRLLGVGAPTPLQLAAETGAPDTVEALLVAGAPVDRAAGVRPPPLDLALRNGRWEAALRLISAGATLAGPAAEETAEHVVAHWRARERVGEPCGEAELAVARALADAGGRLPGALPGGDESGEDAGGGARADAPDDGPEGAAASDGDARRSVHSGHLVLDYDWQPAQDALDAHVREAVEPVDGGLPIDPASTRIEIAALPWYDAFRLVRLSDPTWPVEHLAVYYLASADGDLYRLDGRSPPIHEANATAPLRLDEGNVLDYLRFFCFFVRGEEGPFHIAESVDDPVLPQEVDRKTRAVLEGTLRPATYEGRDDQGRFLCDAVVFYSNALFFANFAIQPTGMTEMIDDVPIAADLPARIHAPIAWSPPDDEADDGDAGEGPDGSDREAAG